MAWSPNGEQLVYSDVNNKLTAIDPRKVWAAQQPRLLADGNLIGNQPVWSPNGAILACIRGITNGVSQGTMAYRPATGAIEKILDFGLGVKWLSDSRRVLVSTLDEIFVYDFQTRKTRKVMSVSLDPFATFDISRDSRRLYFSQRMSEADLWLIDLTGQK